MQVDGLGEQQRHQDVAVQGLDDRVGRHHDQEVDGPAELQQPDGRDGNRHDRGANVRDKHGDPHQQRQQRRVVQAQQRQRDVRDDRHDDDLDELAADVIGDLHTHVRTDSAEQTPTTRQQDLEAPEQPILVLEEEEQRDGRQDQEDQHAKNVRQLCQNPLNHRGPEFGHLLIQGRRPVGHRSRREHVGVLPRQFGRKVAQPFDRTRQCVDKIAQLRPHNGQDADDQRDQHTEEQHLHHADGQQPRHAPRREPRHGALQQEREGEPGKHGREHRAQEDDDQQSGHDGDDQEDRFLVREVPVDPAADDLDEFHGPLERIPSRQPSAALVCVTAV